MLLHEKAYYATSASAGDCDGDCHPVTHEHGTVLRDNQAVPANILPESMTMLICIPPEQRKMFRARRDQPHVRWISVRKMRRRVMVAAAVRTAGVQVCGRASARRVSQAA